MAQDGDFVLEEEDEDENKEFNRAFENLKKSADLFLTTNEMLFEVEEDTDSDNELTKISDMRYKAETQTKSQFKGAASITDRDSNASMMDYSMRDGDDTRENILKDINGESAVENKQSDNDKDVQKLMNTIANKLAT